MKRKLSDIYCCDFETTSSAQFNIEGRTKVYLYLIKNIKTDEELYGVNISEWYDDVIKHKISIIYFHNLTFDGTFIINYLLNIGYESVCVNPLENQFYAIIDDYNNIYSITINHNGFIVKLLCSYKLTSLSIKKIGESLGLEKLDETHNYQEIKKYKSLDEIPKEELLYIQRDVDIQIKGILWCDKLGIRNMTASSSAYSLWSKDMWCFIRDNIRTEYNDTVENMVLRSFRGGITMVNKKFAGKLIENALSYDNNSLYPAAMLGSIPIGDFKEFEKIEDIPKNYSERLYRVNILRAKIKDGYIPFIPTSKSFTFKGVYEYNENIEMQELMLWSEEYDLFALYYEGVWEISHIVAWQGSTNVFTKYINKWRKIKENAPNPSPIRDLSKLMLNSLFGKFAQSEIRQSKKPLLDICGDVTYVRYTSTCKRKDRKISSRITSRARCILIRAINKYPERFIYCDTDSIFLTGFETPDIPIDSKKFGYWKFEYYYDKIKCLKAKCYIAKIKDKEEYKSAIAGLPKSAQKTIKFDDFKNGLKLFGIKKRLKRVRGGIIIDNTDFEIHVNNDNVVAFNDLMLYR